jgi:hypothetical protein
MWAHEISAEGASYASSMAIEEGCLTAGECICFDIGRNDCHRTSSFFFLFCCVRVEAIGCPLGVLGSSRHFGRWRCMDLVGCQYLKKVGLWNRLTRGVALSQVSAFAFRIY